MRTRPAVRSALLAIAALVGGLLVAGSAPSTAATAPLHIKSSTIAVGHPTASGNVWGKVKVYCPLSSTCKGKLRFQGTPIHSTYVTKYSVGSRKYATLNIWLWDTTVNGKDNVPNDLFTDASGTANPAYFDDGHLRRYIEVYGSGRSTVYKPGVWVEPLVSGSRVRAQVQGDWQGITDASLTLFDVKGLATNEVQTIGIDGNGAVEFKSKAIGLNNTLSSNRYRIRVSAKVDGVRRTWWWRGTRNSNHDAISYGGGKTVEEGSSIALDKYAPFNVKIQWGAFSGTVSDTDGSGGEVHVLGVPARRPSGAGARALDYSYCANGYGSDDVASDGGAWRVGFVPMADSGADSRSRRKYIVQVAPHSGSASWERFNKTFGSCNQAIGYVSATSAPSETLRDVATSSADGNTTLSPETSTVEFRPRYSGFAEQYHDRYISLRRYIPGVHVLDMPIVAQGVVPMESSVTGKRTKLTVPPGKYYAEIGRRTGCATWYPSIYSNNDAYLQGEDRGAERWKSFGGAAPDPELPKNSALWLEAYKHGFASPPAYPDNIDKNKGPGDGKKGWMYREACKAAGAGAKALVWVKSDSDQIKMGDFSDGDNTADITYVPYGASVTGHVSRAGGKSNKEMMVSLYSVDGTRVMRSAFTSSSGNFRIWGLAPGKYNVLVNGDSWRGIGRAFSGAHTKSVSAGNTYSVGTLRFSQ